MLAFVDHNGRRRDVAVELPPEHRNRPLLAVYDKRTPSAAERPRVAVPRLMATESARTASLAKLRSAMRIETDRRASTASPRQGRDGTVVGELERLAALHSDGSLTDEEFAAAKHRLLGL
ncbi:SHOCT domain-containing protein [Stackebrandtia soli]|uniref:SHOCT domain-containing protein n=1 Tax=Stackebrandtia soli TaxID=1892856 RepID=UPI0039EA8AE1